MAIIRISLGQGLQELHRLFVHLEQSWWVNIAHLPRRTTSWIPPVDIFESPAELIVVVSCPGAQRESLEITLEDRFLRVRGQTEPLYRQARVYQLEGAYGPFERVVRLPCLVNGQEARATLEEGLLKIYLPKILH